MLPPHLSNKFPAARMLHNLCTHVICTSLLIYIYTISLSMNISLSLVLATPSHSLSLSVSFSLPLHSPTPLYIVLSLSLFSFSSNPTRLGTRKTKHHWQKTRQIIMQLKRPEVHSPKHQITPISRPSITDSSRHRQRRIPCFPILRPWNFRPLLRGSRR